jgi:hypothetical protein
MDDETDSLPTGHPRGYVCYRADGPITIDGKLDDAAWEAASWTEPHRDIEGDLKPEPHLLTREKMLWDDEFLYIAAELEEPHVWATLTEHDSVIFRDNDFEVFIDPDGDCHEYYEFEVNALGTWWDLLLTKPYKDGGSAVDGWEIPGVQVAVHVDGTLNDPSDEDRGWTLEIAFPWKALAECAHRPAPPNHGDQWRINFSRVEWDVEIADGSYRKIPDRPERNWIWSPQGVVDMHRPETWGYLQFSTAQPGTDPFVPDPAWPARETLSQIYYAQRAFRESRGEWARSLAQLDIQTSLHVRPEIFVTPSLFEAVVEVPLDSGRSKTWHIAQDARIWSDA